MSGTFDAHRIEVAPSRGPADSRSYRAVCSCGWASIWRSTEEIALQRGWEHRYRNGLGPSNDGAEE